MYVQLACSRPRCRRWRDIVYADKNVQEKMIRKQVHYTRFKVETKRPLKLAKAEYYRNVSNRQIKASLIPSSIYS